MSSSVTYRAYLIRMWRTVEGEWRASLDDPRTGERRCFARLEHCFEYLVQVTRSGTAAAQPATTDAGCLD